MCEPFSVNDFMCTKGVKFPRPKYFFTDFFFICSLRFNGFLHILPEVQCPNVLDFQNPWEKVMERSGLRFEKLLLINGVK